MLTKPTIALLASLLLTPSIALAQTPTTAPAIPAFPGAEGYGALVTGGRNGQILHVTTLADSGPGSFRDAVSQPNHTIVFDLAGIITLNSNVDVANDTTILGQTAPGQGICLYNRTTSLSDHHNIIIRYLRFREGIKGDSGKCAINMATVNNIILDHCSIEWGRWDSMGLTKGSHDVTVQNCIIGASIDPQRFGALVDTVERVTLSHNLWLHNHSRNPKVKGTIQYINNVVYDWGITGLAGGHSAADHYVDVINNFLIKGPDSNNQAAGGFTSTDHVYNKGNLVDLDPDGKLNGVPLKDADYAQKTEAPTFMDHTWANPPIPVTTLSAEEAYKQAVSPHGAGCSLQRDGTDDRLIADVTSLGKLGHISKTDADAGGLLPIPAATAIVPTPSKPLDPNSPYSPIEQYANTLIP